MNFTDFEQHFDETILARGFGYGKALVLCSDGEQKNSNYVGLMKEWKQFRYFIYERTGDIPAQKALARELLLDGDFEYFKKREKYYER